MAKTKRKREPRAESAEPQTQEDSPYLPDADPPRPNRIMLSIAIVLFAGWFIFLVYVAVWMS